MKLSNIAESGDEMIVIKSLETIERILRKGDSRLAKPLMKNEIKIMDVVDGVKKQGCIRVGNYTPDSSNEHLRHISLGPSYLEQQLSRAINRAVKKKLIPAQWAEIVNQSIGLK